MSDDRKVISIEDLKKISEGEIVELPSFVEGESFFVRLRRPSMLQLAKSGKIPNELLIDANALFANGTSQAINRTLKDDDTLSRIFNLIEVICEAAFVEPTYKEIKQAGIELTDSQLLAVFSYTQNGVEGLKSFH